MYNNGRKIYMNSKIWVKVIATSLLFIFIVNTIVTSSSLIKDIRPELSENDQLGFLNPSIYYNVDVLIISRQFEITELIGNHKNLVGKGIDEKITLYGEYWWPVHLFILWKDSDFILRNGVGINTKIEIFNFDGWIFGHKIDTIFPRMPLKLYGHSDMMKITVYRG
jgi:hypothetical protein